MVLHQIKKIGDLRLKKTKEDLEHGKSKKQTAKPQVQTSFEMEKATQLKAQILQYITRQQLFGINIVDFAEPMAKEYLHIATWLGAC